MINALYYAQPRAQRQQTILYDKNTMIFIIGKGVCVYNVQTGVQTYYQIDESDNLEYIHHYHGKIVISSTRNKIYVVQLEESVPVIKNASKLLGRHADAPILHLEMNASNIFVVTYGALIFIDVSDLAVQNATKTSLVDSTCVLDDFLFLGCADNTVEALKIEGGKIVDQKTINVAHQSANERKASIVALNAVKRSNGHIFLLVSPLYGPSKLYSISQEELHAKLVFQLSKQFFGQTLTNALSNEQIFIAGTNKQVAVLNWNNNLLQTIGQDYEEGCGIFEIQLQENTLLVRFETGKNFFFTLDSKNGKITRNKHQLLGCGSSVNDRRSKILQLNKQIILYCRDRFITVLDGSTLQNIEVASELGSEIYCVEKIAHDKYVIGGDENEARVIQIPFYFYLLNNALIMPQNLKENTIKGQIPVQGLKQALDPTISAVYITKDNQINNFEELQNCIKEQNPDIDCVSAPNGLSMRTQFYQNAFFPQVNQISYFGGANLYKIIYDNKTDLIYMLSKSERSNEPTFKIIKYSENRQQYQLIGAFDDFTVFEGNVVIIDRFGVVSIIANNKITYTQKIQLDFNHEVQVSASQDTIVVGSGNKCSKLNWKLEKVSQEEYSDAISAIMISNDKIILGTSTGCIYNNKEKILQLSGQIDNIKETDEQNIFLIIDVNGLAVKFTIQ